MNPPKRITDRDFHYVPAASTDLKKTFARLKRAAARQQIAEELERREPIPIKRVAK